MEWQDWAFCSPGPRWREEDRAHLVLLGAQLHAPGPSWATPAGCVAAGLASDRPPAPLHDASHTSTPTATWRRHMQVLEPTTPWVCGVPKSEQITEDRKHVIVT